MRRKITIILAAALIVLLITPYRAEAATPSGAVSTLYYNDFYYIVSAVNPNMVLDVRYASRNNGAKIQLYKKNGGDNQLFRFVRLKNGYLTLINRGSKKAVDIAGGATGNGTQIQLWEKNGTAAQQWSLERSGTRFKLRARCGKYLDVNGGSSRNGTKIQIWDGNSSNAQYFYFVPYVQYSTRTIKLGDFSNFDRWKRNMQAAERSVTFGGSFNSNPSGNTYYSGGIITGMTVLEYKTITARVSVNTPGYYKTIKVTLPKKIRFKIHKHSTRVRTWFDFSALNFWQQCECGYRDEWKWDIPYFTTEVSPDGVWQNQEQILKAVQPSYRVLYRIRQ